MTKCANCENGAIYTYAITPTYGIDYCSRHVPKFLHAQKVAGLIPLREVKPVVIEEPIVAPKKTTRKKITE
jgi:hypothetical protein